MAPAAAARMGYHRHYDHAIATTVGGQRAGRDADRRLGRLRPVDDDDCDGDSMLHNATGWALRARAGAGAGAGAGQARCRFRGDTEGERVSIFPRELRSGEPHTYSATSNPAPPPLPLPH